MIRYRTMVSSFFSMGLAAAIGAGVTAAADPGDALTVQQVLTGDVAFFCPGLPMLRTADRQAVLMELYQHNDLDVLWQDLHRLAVLQAELDEIANDGLDPEDYSFALRATPPKDPCSELRISSEYVLALEHLSRGRLTHTDHEPFWQADNLPPASALTVAELAVMGLRQGVEAAFDEARPAMPSYRALRAAFVSMDRDTSPRPAVPPGPTLRPGMSDERVGRMVAILRQDGFMLPTADAVFISDPLIYDETMELAVRRFQASRGLRVDGIIGPQTIREMNILPAQRVQQVKINLERLRWINGLRSDYLLLINIAAGDLQLLRGDELVWQARVQVGTPGRPTPPLVSYINRVTLNPSWTVPPTILREDLLPLIHRDRQYLEERNMQILDAEGNPLDPQRVDWQNPGGIILRQPPGEGNPLGQIVFRLPNPFSIYLHDTPSQHLFQLANRSVSSGCVRVEAATDLAFLLFSGLGAAERRRVVDRLASGQTQEVPLANGPRVILAYWTAYGDAEGRPAFVPDGYARDQALKDAMTVVHTQLRAGESEAVRQAQTGCW